MKEENELDSMPIREDESAEIKNVDCGYDPITFRKSITTIKGKICPCCGRLAKYYHRKLTATQCLALLHILKWYRTEPSAVTFTEDNQEMFEFFNLDEMFKHNPKLKKDFTLLMYFDLIEHKGRMEVRGKKNPKEVLVVKKGYYRISLEGVKFAQRETAIPITAIVYNGKVEAHKLYPYKTIEEILSEAGYDYDTLIDLNYLIK